MPAMRAVGEPVLHDVRIGRPARRPSARVNPGDCHLVVTGVLLPVLRFCAKWRICRGYIAQWRWR